MMRSKRSAISPMRSRRQSGRRKLRDRYFNALAACTEVVNVAYEKTVGCEFKAHLEAMKEADTLIAVFDPDNPLCEREAAAVAVAELLNKHAHTVNPKTIRLS